MNYRMLVTGLQVALVSAVLEGSALAAPVIEIEGAWVRSLPAVSRVNSAYMKIHNRGDQADRLLSVRTPIADVSKVHLSTMHDGMMKMERVEGGLEVPAGAEVLLRSGGYHLMLMQLKDHPLEGETVMLYLRFEHTGEIAVEAAVLSDAPGVSAGMQTKSPAGMQDHAEPEQ
ncbi:MAG: copper(I)-binding protein [Motiliproteus sp.]|jgi:copper(I)-binding protein